MAGSIFVADSENFRIRQISPDGIIQTVAGNGEFGFSGDGGPATNSSLFVPKGLAADAVGNLFIADTFNHRIRQVSRDGIIRTVAGTGIYTGGIDGEGGDLRDDLGDGGFATGASLDEPEGLAVDAAGNLFIADAFNNRVRQVSPDGVIQTVAGNGIGSFFGDGGDATSASLDEPGGLAVDEAGNLFVADSVNNRVRQVSPNGVIRTLAGIGESGFSGDGGLATNASLSLPADVAVDAVGNLFIADTDNDRVRVVLAKRPTFNDPVKEEISITGRSGGSPVQSGALLVTASVVDLPVLNSSSLPQVSFSSSTDARWLSASPNSGATPRLLRITADPLELAPGEYEGKVTITMPHAEPAEQVILVRFSVGPPIAARLGVEAESLSFTYPLGTAARSESFLVLNEGGGELPFTVASETDTGGDWLIARPTSGAARPGDPVKVEVTADLGGLAVGTYTGQLIIEAEAAGSPVVIPVTMTISEIDQAILLSQSGLSFTAVEQGGIVPPQTFGVLNLGRGSMGWSVTTCSLTKSACAWLKVTPDSGASDSSSEVPRGDGKGRSERT